jgi:hypothetical protein
MCDGFMGNVQWHLRVGACYSTTVCAWVSCSYRPGMHGGSLCSLWMLVLSLLGL